MTERDPEYERELGSQLLAAHAAQIRREIRLQNDLQQSVLDRQKIIDNKETK